MIVRRPSGEDRRKLILDITAAGRKALAQDMAARDLWLASALPALTEAERLVLRLAANLIERIVDADTRGNRGGVGND